MNKKVLKTMLWLVVGELIAWYILKIFFPEQFVMAIQNENLIKAGQYVDTHKWLLILVACVTSFFTYWFYLCAVCRKWTLSIREILIVIIVIAITQGLYEYDVNLSSAIATISMILLPYLFKAELKTTAIVFSVHYLAQSLSIIIRDLPSLLTSINTLTILFMGFESYFWLFLFYLYYNYKEKEV